MSSKTVVTVQLALGWILALAGGLFALLFLSTFFFGWSTDDPLGTKIAVEIILLMFTACAGLAAFAGIRMLMRLHRFQIYRSYLAYQDAVPLDTLVHRIKKDREYVIRDLEKMITRRFFVNVYLDMDQQALAIVGYRDKIKNRPMEVVECKSCGAKNVCPVGGVAYCEYCQSPLH